MEPDDALPGDVLQASKFEANHQPVVHLLRQSGSTKKLSNHRPSFTIRVRQLEKWSARVAWTTTTTARTAWIEALQPPWQKPQLQRYLLAPEVPGNAAIINPPGLGGPGAVAGVRQTRRTSATAAEELLSLGTHIQQRFRYIQSKAPTKRQTWENGPSFAAVRWEDGRGWVGHATESDRRAGVGGSDLKISNVPARISTRVRTAIPLKTQKTTPITAR